MPKLACVALILFRLPLFIYYFAGFISDLATWRGQV